MEIDDIREILPLFINHAHAGVAIKSLSGCYLFANWEFCRYLDADPTAVVGRSDEDLLPAARARNVAAFEKAAVTMKKGVSSDEKFWLAGAPVSYLSTRFPIFDDLHRLVALGAITMEAADAKGGATAAEQALKAARETNAQLRDAIRTLEELASTDRLTGAWNRRRFEDTADAEMHRSARYGHPLTMMLLDVDHFKRVNDTYGHNEGDRVLVRIGERIRAAIRKSDSLTRWGGEEFIVLMPNTGLVRAQALAERVRETVAAEPIERIGTVTASIGVAQYLAGETLEEWLGRADRVMYRAKHDGRDRVNVDPQCNSEHAGDQHMEGSFVHLVWKESFQCGHPLIDAQHRQLFTIANELLGALLTDRPRDEVLEVVRRLVDDVRRHFRDEERILAELGYEGCVGHAREHAKLMDEAVGLARAYEAGRFSLGALFQFLAHNVISRHLLGADREYFALTEGLAR